MIRFLFKALGLLAFAAAVITAILDLTRSIANSTLTMTPLGKQWFEFHPESFLQLQPAVERYIHPYLWYPVLQSIFSLPSWLVFTLIAFLFLWLGRKRRHSWQQRFGK